MSIVMGVHNGGRRLRETLENLLGQKNVDLEVIAVDDGSSDETGLILAEYARRDSRVVFKHQIHQGLTQALIRGCEQAQGLFIGRQDVGDVSEPDRVHKQLERLATRVDAVMVSCGVRTVGPRGEHLYDTIPEELAATRSLRTASMAVLRGPGAHGSVLFRRDAYEQVGGYRPEFYFAQDLDLWVRLAERGRHTIVPEVLFQTTVEPDSVSGAYHREQTAMRRLVFESARKRRAGLDDSRVLARARAIRPVSRRQMSVGIRRAAALYFVASCLSRRGDDAAVGYLRQAVRENPLHLKAWCRLLTGLTRPRGQ